MALKKVVTATRKERTCDTCGKLVKIGERFYKSNESLEPPKPFPVKIYCIKCGDEKGGIQSN